MPHHGDVAHSFTASIAIPDALACYFIFNMASASRGTAQHRSSYHLIGELSGTLDTLIRGNTLYNIACIYNVQVCVLLYAACSLCLRFLYIMFLFSCSMTRAALFPKLGPPPSYNVASRGHFEHSDSTLYGGGGGGDWGGGRRNGKMALSQCINT